MQIDNFIERFVFYQKYSWNYCWEHIQIFSMSNPFLFTLVCLLLAFGLEYLFPRKINYNQIKRKGFWLDLFYVLFYDFIIIFLGIFAITNLLDYYLFEFLKIWGINKSSIIIWNINKAPVWMQVLVLFIVVDFMEWLAHFLMHRIDFLWAFHKIHHAQEEIGVASSRHFHIGEYFIFKPMAYLPFIFLGYSATHYATYTSFLIVFLAFFTHANAKIPLGPLNYIINSPNTHIWHHAKNIPLKYGVNFASVLNIWDVIFGFYYLPTPKESQPELGLFDIKDVPKSFLGQFIYPFTYLFSAKSKTNDFAEVSRAYQAKKVEQISRKKRKKHKRKKS